MKKITKKIETFKGEVVCPTCGNKRMLETTDKTVLENPPNCFPCHMSSGPKIKPKITKRRLVKYEEYEE